MHFSKFHFGLFKSILLSFFLLCVPSAGGPLGNYASLTVSEAHADGEPIVAGISASPMAINPGDTVFFTATIYNQTPEDINDLSAVIALPSGLSYLPGTMKIDSQSVPDPVVTNQLSVPLSGAADSGITKTLTFNAAAGAGIPEGKLKVSFYTQSGQINSNISVLSLTLQPEFQFESSTLIGKVFNDKNSNGVQDKGEEGLGSVKLATEEGIIVTTDEHGRYHIPGLSPGRHLIAIDTTTTPPGSKLTTPKAVLIKSTGSLINKANFGVKLLESEEQEDEGNIPISVNIDQNHAHHLNRQLNIKLRNDAGTLPETDPELILTNNYPHFISGWQLNVLNANGSIVRSINGFGAPNEIIKLKSLNILPGNYTLELAAFDKAGQKDKNLFNLLIQNNKTIKSRRNNGLFSFALSPKNEQQFNIPVQGNAVRLHGQADPDSALRINAYPVTIGEDGKYEQTLILPSGEHWVTFKIKDINGTTHTLTKMVRVSENYFMFVGLIEEEMGILDVKGDREGLGSQSKNRLENNLYFDGRLAYYFKAEIKGKFRITSSLDTARDTNDLYPYSDREKFYSTYGDGSNLEYDAASTQDKFFLLLEADRSYFKWGSYGTGFTGTELARYNRSLHGAKLHYQSTGTSEQGDPNTVLTAFSSNARQLSSHDELRATGGSLYYLKNKNIKAGSEKIYLETRSEISNITLSIKEMIFGRDYTIDYEQGRVIFYKPVSALADSNETIISSELSDGDPVYVITDYEFETSSALKDLSYGLRFAQQVLPRLRLGATFVEETRENADYSLKAADAKINLPFNTEILAEAAQTRHFQLRNFISDDGGITFTQLSNPDSEKIGEAYKIEAASRPFKNTLITAYYKNIDENFSTANTSHASGLEKYGARLSQNFGNNLTLNVYHDTQKALEEGSTKLGADKVHKSTVQGVYKKENLDLTTEYRHEQYENLRNVYRSAVNDYAAVQIGYNLTEALRIFSGVQKTIQGDEKDQVRFGFNAKLNDKTDAYLMHAISKEGNSTRIGFERTEDENTQYYTHYTIENDNGEQDLTLTVGGRTQLTPNTKIYKEDQFSRENYGSKLSNIYGINTKLNDKMGFDFSYEKTKTESTAYQAGRLSFNYNGKKLKARNGFEIRYDDSAVDKRQYLGTGYLQYQPNNDLTLMTRFEYSLTNARQSKAVLARFDEFEAGLAYRPVEFDWFNFIYQYKRTNNVSPESQYDFNNIGKSFQEEHAAELALDINSKLTLTEKVAYINKFQQPRGQTAVPSKAFLLAHRLNFHLNNKWDIIAEFRTLHQDNTDVKKGLILEIDRYLNDYLRIGVGYHFAEYDNELTPSYDYRAKGFFMRFTGTFAWLTKDDIDKHKNNISKAEKRKNKRKYIKLQLVKNDGALLKTFNENLLQARDEMKKNQCDTALRLYSQIERMCTTLNIEADELADDYLKKNYCVIKPDKKIRKYEHNLEKILKQAQKGIKKARRKMNKKTNKEKR